MWQSVTSRIRWYHIAGLVVLVVLIAAAVWYWLDRRKAIRVGSSNGSNLVEGGEGI